ncbi:MAG: hypothetical protein ACI9VM_000226 [Candidatus Azotimanducaceae bacterium]|jgi:hypothetical protein
MDTQTVETEIKQAIANLEDLKLENPEAYMQLLNEFKEYVANIERKLDQVEAA